jgi:hypothetical protein
LPWSAKQIAVAKDEMQRRVAEIEQDWRGKLGALESRINALEATERFGGAARKRIITHRDKDGNPCADVIEREGNGNGYDNNNNWRKPEGLSAAWTPSSQRSPRALLLWKRA